MPLDDKHLAEATNFITDYKNAINVLKLSAREDKLEKSYQTFLASVIDWQNGQRKLDLELEKKIRLFQFSQYFSLKYLQGLDAANPSQISEKLRSTWKPS